jgi:4-carboxymuconolactone decarboxylase
MSRIPFPTPETMSEAQKRVYERIVSGPRGRLVGPLRAALHNPELAERWQAFGALLRYGTSLPPRVSELAIVVTARRWNSQIEWHIHAQAAADAGIAPAVLEAIRARRTPAFETVADEIVYEYARQLQETGQVAPALYARAVEHWDVVGVVELTAVIGYYTLVSMTLNAHEIPLPDDAPAPLDVPAEAGQPTLSRLAPLPHKDDR